MPKVIDVHIHPPLPSGYSTIGGRFMKLFEGVDMPSTSPEEMFEFYEERDIFGILLAIDDETISGVPYHANDELAGLVERWPRRFAALGSVDPHKGEAAIVEARRCATELGMKGIKLHPPVQQFYMNDRQYWPLWEECQKQGLVLLIHAGTTGVGARMPGGGGIELNYGKPMPYMDEVAANFPELQMVLAHPARPWVDEQLEMVIHKKNVYMDLSGWMPKYFDPLVIQYANTIARKKVMFGTDYPAFSVDRWMKEWRELPVKDEVQPLILFENANKLFDLGLSYTP
jgi:predicted TIM-barrel fold metal-dependent hydrolase